MSTVGEEVEDSMMWMTGTPQEEVNRHPHLFLTLTLTLTPTTNYYCWWWEG